MDQKGNFKPERFPPKGWVYNPTKLVLIHQESKQPYKEKGRKVRFSRIGERLPSQAARKTVQPTRKATKEDDSGAEVEEGQKGNRRKQTAPVWRKSSGRCGVYHRPKPATRKDAEGNILPPPEQRPQTAGQGMILFVVGNVFYVFWWSERGLDRVQNIF